jgi:HAD superfamily hydrolase (TIGR01549 family)
MTLTVRNSDALSRRPACVILDTDNTIYAYEPAHRQAMAATRQKAARLLSISEEHFDAAFAEARSQVKARLGSTASSHSRLLYFHRMLELIGLRTQVLMALDFEQTYWRSLLTSAELFDGVKDFLDDLRSLDIPIVIITDLTSQIQFRKIAYWGLDQYFDYVVTSEEAGFDKPHAAPFELALEKIGNVGRPLWMIGDDPVTDVQGGRKHIGAATLQKKHAGVQVLDGPDGPDAVFEHFGELRKLLANCRTGD